MLINEAGIYRTRHGERVFIRNFFDKSKLYRAWGFMLKDSRPNLDDAPHMSWHLSGRFSFSAGETHLDIIEKE